MTASTPTRNSAPPTFREERYAWWSRQADENRRAGDPALTALCERFAAAWAAPFGDVIDWEKVA